MKGVALLAPGQVQVVEYPEPVPQKGELLLKVEMVGLCGTDLNSFRGRNPLVSYPRVIGHEIAATVVHGSSTVPAGSHVTVSPYTSCGQCAACLRGRMNACLRNETFGVQRDGALSEWLVVPEEKVYGSTLPLKALCLTEPLTVGVHAVARGRVTAADTVVVFGCGGVGLGAIAGSAFRGARTIAVDVDDAKLAIAKAVGAAEVLHSGREDIAARLLELTRGTGPDVVIEAIGLPQTFQAAVDLVAFAGRVVYIGYAQEPVAYQTKLFVQKELDILGSRNALPPDFKEVIALLESGRVPVDEIVSAVVPMDETASMLTQWSATPAAFTKIMVRVGA